LTEIQEGKKKTGKRELMKMGKGAHTLTRKRSIRRTAAPRAYNSGGVWRKKKKKVKKRVKRGRRCMRNRGNQWWLGGRGETTMEEKTKKEGKKSEITDVTFPMNFVRATTFELESGKTDKREDKTGRSGKLEGKGGGQDDGRIARLKPRSPIFKEVTCVLGGRKSKADRWSFRGKPLLPKTPTEKLASGGGKEKSRRRQPEPFQRSNGRGDTLTISIQ